MNAHTFLIDALGEPAGPRDLLSQAIGTLRPMLDRKRTPRQRVRIFWAAVKNSRTFAASDVLATEFYQLADDCGLVADLDDRRRRLSGEVTIRHVIDWGLRGMNPFETGPLE
jgi:hypothetical protein